MVKQKQLKMLCRELLWRIRADERADKEGHDKSDITFPLFCMIEYCLECDSITPFIDPGLCFYCGCHGPCGDWENPDLSEEDRFKHETEVIAVKSMVELDKLTFTSKNKLK